MKGDSMGNGPDAANGQSTVNGNSVGNGPYSDTGYGFALNALPPVWRGNGSAPGVFSA